MFPNDDSEKIGKETQYFRRISARNRTDSKDEKRNGRREKIYESFFSSSYVKPYGDATFWKKLSTWKIHSRI